MQNLISISDLTPGQMVRLIQLAGAIERGEVKPDMRGKIAALLFFEPSTRTCFSFDTAMKKLGGQTIVMAGT